MDGFNLYHALDNLNQPHLKWLNLWALGERLLPRGKESLVKVRYFTALKTADPDKKQRHREYIAALTHFRVETREGHFISDTIDCRKCGHVWDAPKEKESDVNLALGVLDDAYQNVFDVAYLLTADSDQGATARVIKERFPGKRLVTVAPPGQEISKAIRTHTEHRQKIPTEFIEDCLLPPLVIERVGGKDTLRFRRPAQYKPPDGWVAPKDRRQAK